MVGRSGSVSPIRWAPRPMAYRPSVHSSVGALAGVSGAGGEQPASAPRRRRPTRAASSVGRSCSDCHLTDKPSSPRVSRPAAPRSRLRIEWPRSSIARPPSVLEATMSAGYAAAASGRSRPGPARRSPSRPGTPPASPRRAAPRTHPGRGTGPSRVRHPRPTRRCRGRRSAAAASRTVRGAGSTPPPSAPAPAGPRWASGRRGLAAEGGVARRTVRLLGCTRSSWSHRARSGDAEQRPRRPGLPVVGDRAGDGAAPGDGAERSGPMMIAEGAQPGPAERPVRTDDHVGLMIGRVVDGRAERDVDAVGQRGQQVGPGDHARIQPFLW